MSEFTNIELDIEFKDAKLIFNRLALYVKHGASNSLYRELIDSITEEDENYLVLFQSALGRAVFNDHIIDALEAKVRDLNLENEKLEELINENKSSD